MKKYKFELLDSTNNYMKINIDKFNEYDIVIAKNQSAGKGRQGNTWISLDGMALFSFLFIAEGKIKDKDYPKLPLIVGISVLEALQELEKGDYKFKWTNDIYISDKKISGILIERKNNKFIIGIGINVNNEIPDTISEIAIALKNKYEIDTVIDKVILKFKNNINKFINGYWSEILNKINEYNYLYKKEIKIKIGDKKLIDAISLDIIEDGRLRVIIDNEQKLFNVGEIIIKRN